MWDGSANTDNLPQGQLYHSAHVQGPLQQFITSYNTGKISDLVPCVPLPA